MESGARVEGLSWVVECFFVLSCPVEGEGGGEREKKGGRGKRELDGGVNAVNLSREEILVFDFRFLWSEEGGGRKERKEK